MFCLYTSNSVKYFSVSKNIFYKEYYCLRCVAFAPESEPNSEQGDQFETWPTQSVRQPESGRKSQSGKKHDPERVSPRVLSEFVDMESPRPHIVINLAVPEGINGL